LRTLNRNKQTIWYALFEGTTAITDTSGNYTGEETKTYSDPVAMKANYSRSSSGSNRYGTYASTTAEPFGLYPSYKKSIVTDDMNCPVAEDSILWIGIAPEDESGNAVKHNFVVRGVSKSLNSITYSVEEVDVT